MRLETERLILRNIIEKDMKSLIKNINHFEIASKVSTIPHPYKLKDAKWWIDKCKKNAREKPRKSYDFVIELKSEKKVIGGVGLFDIKDGKGEIGCWLGKKYWRQGIMMEAVVELIDFAFNKLKLRKLVWKAYVTNKASNLLAEKVGFKKEGLLRKDTKCMATGKIHNGNIYGLLKEEWKNHKKKLK